jgi:hypothetical protein
MKIIKLIEYKKYLYQEDIKVKVSRNNHEFIVKFDEFNNFWTVFDNGTWEENTFLLFDRFINSSTVYIDISSITGVNYANLKSLTEILLENNLIKDSIKHG